MRLKYDVTYLNAAFDCIPSWIGNSDSTVDCIHLYPERNNPRGLIIEGANDFLHLRRKVRVMSEINVSLGGNIYFTSKQFKKAKVIAKEDLRIATLRAMGNIVRSNFESHLRLEQTLNARLRAVPYVEATIKIDEEKRSEIYQTLWHFEEILEWYGYIENIQFKIHQDTDGSVTLMFSCESDLFYCEKVIMLPSIMEDIVSRLCNISWSALSTWTVLFSHRHIGIGINPSSSYITIHAGTVNLTPNLDSMVSIDLDGSESAITASPMAHLRNPKVDAVKARYEINPQALYRAMTLIRNIDDAIDVIEIATSTDASGSEVLLRSTGLSERNILLSCGSNGVVSKVLQPGVVRLELTTWTIFLETAIFLAEGELIQITETAEVVTFESEAAGLFMVYGAIIDE